MSDDGTSAVSESGSVNGASTASRCVRGECGRDRGSGAVVSWTGPRDGRLEQAWVWGMEPCAGSAMNRYESVDGTVVMSTLSGPGIADGAVGWPWG